MKRFLILLLCAIIVFGGCSSKEAAVTSTGEKTDKTDINEEITENDFYKMATSPKRPVAVMIDNDSEASRPQIGLEDAYLVYEIIVEGGASRIMALFKNYRVEKIGPVRSARHYFLDYLQAYSKIESTEVSYMPLSPQIHGLPHYPYALSEWYICYT